MDRTSSRSTTTDSHDAQTSKNRRRSGLFGLLGKKDKDEVSYASENGNTEARMPSLSMTTSSKGCSSWPSSIGASCATLKLA